jgi:hypothetical protein
MTACWQLPFFIHFFSVYVYGVNLDNVDVNALLGCVYVNENVLYPHLSFHLREYVHDDHHCACDNGYAQAYHVGVHVCA